VADATPDPGAVQGQATQESGSDDYNALQFWLQTTLQKMQTGTLVRISKVYAVAGALQPVGFVDVVPLVNQMTGDRVAEPHGTIYGIPYLRLQGGKNAIILDPEVGDMGGCLFASRDISSVKATRAQANPGSFRTFDWADGLYIGGYLNGTPEQYIQFAATGIAIHSPVQISLDAPKLVITASTSITATSPVMAWNASSSFTITGPMVVAGSFSQSGGAGSFGEDITIAGKPFLPHTHTSATPGNPTSGVN
jgi:hypothetical protein